MIVAQAPVRYKGQLYQTLLEARVAVFLDGLGVRSFYQSPSFALDNLGFFPDFWLPDLAYWLLVDSTVFPDHAETDRATRLALKTSRPVFLARGVEGSIRGFLPDGHGSWLDKSLGYAWFECLTCGKIGLAKPGRDLPDGFEKRCWHKDRWAFDSHRVVASRQVAARFVTTPPVEAVVELALAATP